MGLTLAAYKKAMIDEFTSAINSNNSFYYGFGASPVAISGNARPVTTTDYAEQFTNDWQMEFGKLLVGADISPMVYSNLWVANTIYSRYDNTQTLVDNDFYVFTLPRVGAPYSVFKCIDNANGVPSTVEPSTIQTTTFQTGDGYKWRYITSIPNYIFQTFSIGVYAPIVSNSAIQTTASTYCGVDVIPVTNGGGGYTTTYDGTVVGVDGNNVVLQLSTNASGTSGFFNNCGIYIHTPSFTDQLRIVVSHTYDPVNGNFLTLNQNLETGTVVGGTTTAHIAPQVYVDSDGSTNVLAYSVVNTSAQTIISVVVVDPGSNVSWANAFIASPTVGSGANIYPIVPPPGGHGADPSTELSLQGIGITFAFANTESNTIPVDGILYNKIGIIKNPYAANPDGSKSSNLYTNSTFSQVLSGTIATNAFVISSEVQGVNSGALGTIANIVGNTIYLTGDKNFQNNEVIVANSNYANSILVINTVGQIYAKDVRPLYITNINNINRSNTESELYRVVISL
jgi:hypothetical protein